MQQGWRGCTSSSSLHRGQNRAAQLMDFYFEPRQCGGSAALFGASPSQMTTKFTSQPKRAPRRRPTKQSSNEKADEQIPDNGVREFTIISWRPIGRGICPTSVWQPSDSCHGQPLKPNGQTFGPIGTTSGHPRSKTGHFKADFQQLVRVKAIESSVFMERAMGIEPNAKCGQVAESTSSLWFVGVQ